MIIFRCDQSAVHGECFTAAGQYAICQSAIGQLEDNDRKPSCCCHNSSGMKTSCIRDAVSVAIATASGPASNCLPIALTRDGGYPPSRRGLCPHVDSPLASPSSAACVIRADISSAFPRIRMQSSAGSGRWIHRAVSSPVCISLLYPAL